jgi:AraC-like DNA-binding protein
MQTIYQLINDSAGIWHNLVQTDQASKLVFDHYLFAAELMEINIKKPLSLSFYIAAKSLFLFFVLKGADGNLKYENQTIAKTEQGTWIFRAMMEGNYTFHLPQGEHKILYFIIRPEWMQHHSKAHPKLVSFLKKVNSGIDQIYHLPKCKINRDITRYLLRLERLYTDKADDMEVETLKIFNKLMALYLEMLPANEYVGFVSQAEQAAEIETYILENYKRPDLVSIANLCDEFDMSESKLFRIFKEKKGFTVQAYVLKLKMDLAWSMVKYQNTSFKNIAEQLGFKNQYQFSAAFKKYFKSCPKSLRNEKYPA